MDYYHLILLLCISVLPALALLIYFYRKDKEPEPKKMVLKVFIGGLLIIYPAIWIEKFLMQYLPNTAFFNAFMVAGLVEEFLKFLVVMFLAFRKEAFNQVTDGMVYAMVASLGFATLENIFYVSHFGYAIGITRAFTALPLHAFTSGLMGYYIGCSKFEEDGFLAKRLRFKGLFLAIFLHGLYNFWLFSESYLMILSYLQVYIMWRLTMVYFNYSEVPDKKTPLTLKMLAKYFWDKYNLRQWFKIAVATLILVLIAILTTAMAVQVQAGQMQMLYYLLGMNIVLAPISLSLYRSVGRDSAKILE